MEDWQIAVLTSPHIRVDQSQATGYRLTIRVASPEGAMPVDEVLATVRHSKRKPVIMRPDDPFKGMFASKADVMDILASRED